MLPGRQHVNVEAALDLSLAAQSAAFDFVKRRVLVALDRSLDRAAAPAEDETRANSGAALWW